LTLARVKGRAILPPLLAVGYYTGLWKGNFLHIGDMTLFWSATEGPNNDAWKWSVNANNKDTYIGKFNKANRFSVRCVKSKYVIVNGKLYIIELEEIRDYKKNILMGKYMMIEKRLKMT
jgi:hypothetical protein